MMKPVQLQFKPYTTEKFFLTLCVAALWIFRIVTADALAQQQQDINGPVMYVKDAAKNVVAKIYPSKITDDKERNFGIISGGEFYNTDGERLGYIREHRVYSSDNLEVVSGKQFGKIIRWRTGNIAFRIDTVDNEVQLLNAYIKTELYLEDYKTDMHFIPLLFYLSFFHTSETAPPGYERFDNAYKVLFKGTSTIVYNGDAISGEIVEGDAKVFPGKVSYRLDRRQDVYHLQPTKTTTMNIDVRYDTKEVDIKLYDKDKNLIDPSDALTVDRNEGYKIYPFIIKPDTDYYIAVEGYPEASYKVKVVMRD